MAAPIPECPVCLDADNLLAATHQNNKYSLKGKEQHLFHWDCIKTIYNTFKRYPPCPTCNDPITRLGGIDLRLSSIEAFTQAGNNGRTDVAQSIASRISREERGACLTTAHSKGRFDLVNVLSSMDIPEPYYYKSAQEWTELQLDDRPDLLETLGSHLTEEHRGDLLSNPRSSRTGKEILYSSGPINEKGRGSVLSTAIKEKNHTFALHISTSGSLSKQDRSQCLIEAARARFSDIQEELLKEPVEDEAYQAAFSLAFQNRDAAIAETISAKISFPDRDWEQYVRSARERNWTHVVHNLIDRGELGRDEWQATLVDAALKKDKELVEKAAQREVFRTLSPVNADLLFEKAGQHGWIDTQEKLLETRIVSPQLIVAAISQAFDREDGLFSARKMLGSLKKGVDLTVYGNSLEELKTKAQAKGHGPSIRDLDLLLSKKQQQELNRPVWKRAASACYKIFSSFF